LNTTPHVGGPGARADPASVTFADQLGATLDNFSGR
jgi:hypothetical protein